jgi:hypothetical protein
LEPVRSVYVCVTGLKTSGSEVTEESRNDGATPVWPVTMLSPEKTRYFPFPSSVTVGYQRLTDMFGAAVHEPLDGS